MNIVRFKVSQALSAISFLAVALLFPGFFFYNAAVAFTIIPPIVGGGFGFVAMLLVVPLVFLQASDFILGRTAVSVQDVLFCSTVFFMLIWSGVHFLFGVDYQESLDFYKEVVSALMFWVVLYTSFRNFQPSRKSIAYVFGVSLVLMLIISLMNASGQMFYAASAAAKDVQVASYQGFARSALVTSIILLSICRGAETIFLVAGGVVLLFVLGARSEFAGFFLVSFAVIYSRLGLKRAVFVWGPILLSSLAILAFQANVFDSDSRILQLLDIGDSSSFLARKEAQEYALNTIENNPLWGDYASSLLLGGRGYYSHDALSAWVNYGLLGFLLFVGLNIHAFGRSARAALDPSSLVRPPVVIFAFGMALYSLLMMIFSKSVFDPIFAVAWGAVSSRQFGLFALNNPRSSDGVKQ